MSNTTSTEPPIQPAGFDTLAWSEMLRSSGISKKQAEMQVRVIAQAVQNGAATKSDLLEVEHRLDKRIDKLDKKIDAVEARLESKINQALSATLKWMVGMLVAQTALIVTIMQALISQQ